MTTPSHTQRHHDIAYLTLLQQILLEGIRKGDRTGTGTLSLFGAQLRFSLRHSFPLLTTKKLPFRWIAEELFWFLSGSTHESELSARGVDIWKEWATKEQCARFGREEGDLGPVYGHQFRNFGASHDEGYGYFHNGIDQIAAALQLLDESPDSRRILVSAWNPGEATQVALPPCHTLFQFATHEEMRPSPTDPEGHATNHDHYASRRVLSCHMYMRSADVFLGVPFNIASYALLTHLIAHVLDYEVGDLIVSFGDVHIYSNHVEQVKEQLTRVPRPSPTLTIQPFPEGTRELGMHLQALLSIRYDHLKLANYNPHPKISAPVAV